MSVDTYTLSVDETITLSEVLDSSLVVSEWVVAHIAVSISVIELTTHWSITTVTYSDYDTSHLSHSAAILFSERESRRHEAIVRTRIYHRDDRILLVRIEIRWLIHYAIEIGAIISSLNREYFRSCPTVLDCFAEVRLWKLDYNLTIDILQVDYRSHISS